MLTRYLNRLDTAARALILVLGALFTAAVLLVAQSALRADGVSLATRIVLVSAALLACIRPRMGLLALAGLVPFGDVGSLALGSWMRGAEALVLASLAGALVHAWWSGRVPSFPASGAELAALVFGLIVAASSVEQLWVSQLQRDFAWPFLQDLAAYASRDYLVQYRGFGALFYTLLLLEGLALFVWTADACRHDRGFGARLVGMVVVGATGAAMLSVLRAVTAFVRSGEPAAHFWMSIAEHRWSAHVGDINAAASFFGMCLVIALVCAWTSRKTGRAWLSMTAAMFTGLALWMTQSRTAVAAVLVVAALLIACFVFSRLTSRPAAVVITLALVVPLWLVAGQYLVSVRSDADSAMSIRWMFLTTTARMVQWQPVFGVGIGQYTLWSRHFSPPLLLRHQLENAHDNFAQVAAELGLSGLLALVGLLVTALRGWKRAAIADGAGLAAFLGLLAFLVSWFGSHPLLVPEVAYPFWIVLGVVSGLSRVDLPSPAAAPTAAPYPAPTFPAVGPRLRPAVTSGLLVVVLAASMPLRLKDKASGIDWSRISYGFYAWEQGPSGEPFRWTNARARFFVDATVKRFTLPLRTYLGTPAQPVIVDLLVNDHLANQISIADAAWRTVDVVLPWHADSRYAHVELRVNRSWVPAETDPASSDTRRLSLQVGPLAVRALQDARPGGLH